MTKGQASPPHSQRPMAGAGGDVPPPSGSTEVNWGKHPPLQVTYAL